MRERDKRDSERAGGWEGGEEVGRGVSTGYIGIYTPPKKKSVYLEIVTQDRFDMFTCGTLTYVLKLQ